MNAEHDQVIARVRAALDEVEASRVAAVEPPARGESHRRWLAVAASVVLVGGAVAAIAVNLSHRRSVSPAAGGDTTAPGGGSVPSGELTMPYFLAAADLAPGPVEAGPCCLAAGEMVIAWARGGDLSAGLLLAHVTPIDADAQVTTTADPAAGNTGAVLIEHSRTLFTSYGLTEAERRNLSMQVVPGSGIPYVLPVDGWEFVGMASGQDTTVLYQKFGGAVALEAYLDTSILLDVASAASVRAATVAGTHGWIAEYSGGWAQVLWRDANGAWMRLHLLAAVGDRVDALIAAIVPTNAGGETASTVPTPSQWVGEVSLEMAVSSYALAPYDASTLDPAVGQPIPTIRLTEGEFTVDTPTLFVFVAHWDAASAARVELVADANASGALAGVRVVIVSTAADIDQPQQAAWLAEHGWAGDVLFDTSAGDRSPGMMAGYFGIPGYLPYWVMVDGDGMVAGRATDELTLEDLVTLTSTAGASEPAQSDVVGELEIPGIDVDLFVVDGSGTLDQAARLGPVLVGSALPTTLRAQPASDPVSVVVVGHSTARRSCGWPNSSPAIASPGPTRPERRRSRWSPPGLASRPRSLTARMRPGRINSS